MNHSYSLNSTQAKARRVVARAGIDRRAGVDTGRRGVEMAGTAGAGGGRAAQEGEASSGGGGESARAGSYGEARGGI